jgi:hypothetical protein
MAALLLRSWLRGIAHSSKGGRRRTGHLYRLRSRPYLEVFENRCVPSTVSNLDDAGTGSLRQAIIDTSAGGIVDFQPGLSGTITLSTGELMIAKDLTIAGLGADVITVSGNGRSRVFNIAATFRVNISGLAMADGQVGGIGAQGGGIYNAGTLTITNAFVSGNSASGGGASVGTGLGGGIYNTGMLSLTNSTLGGNSATGTGSVGGAAVGGGIYNAGTLTITNSLISGNSASATGGRAGGNGHGGGIRNTGTLIVTNSTISGNSATGTGLLTGYAVGGGIHDTGTLTITSSTISGNSARGRFGANGGGIYSGGTVTTKNMILAGNAALSSPDIAGVLNSQGHNLIGDGTGGSGYDPTDLLNVDPLLGPLQDNGGPTFTEALLPNSPAIDAGDPTDAPMWDQRGPGFPRVVNGRIDIGAYEHQAVAPTISCSVAQSLLWPPNHQLVNVGLSVDVQPPDATLQVQVYANDNAASSDAADIGPGTLELGAARQGHGSGRVYLIVVTATSGGQTAFDVCTVVVPHDQSADSIARVEAAAGDAEAYYRQFQSAPAGFSLIGGQTSSRYDAAADFSATDNPHGAWSYGWSSTLGSTFNLYQFPQNVVGLDLWRIDVSPIEPNVIHNGTDMPLYILEGTALYQPGQLGAHPGIHGEYSLFRWTAPANGSISIATTFSGTDFVGPTTTDVHVLRDGISIFDGIVNGYGPGSGPSFADNLTVSAGDTIDFAVGWGPDQDVGFDNTGIAASISYTAPSVTVAPHLIASVASFRPAFSMSPPPPSPSLVASIGAGSWKAPFVNPAAVFSQSRTLSVIPATDPTDNMLAGGTVVPVDGYFGLCSQARGSDEGDSWLPEFRLNEDGLLA